MRLRPVDSSDEGQRVAGETERTLGRRDAAAVVSFGLLLNLISIAGRQLTGHDEPRVAGIARAMALTGDFATPELNGSPFLEYPPLGYIPAALLLKVTGAASEFAVHLPGALFATATALLTAILGACLAGRSVGLAAGLILTTIPSFWSLHRNALVDPSLVFFITLSLTGFALAWEGAPRARAWAAMFWLGLAGGFLSKGLIGVGIPVLTAGAYAIVRRDRAALGRLGFPWGPFLAAAPVALWLFTLNLDLREEVFRQSVWRFSSPEAHHSGPVWFYVAPLFTNTMPLALLVVAALALRGGALSFGRAALFPALWVGLTFAGLSAASAKRNLYFAPVYPAAAILAGMLWVRIRERLALRRPWGVAYLGAMTAFLAVNLAVPILSEDREDSLRPAFEFVDKEQGRRALLLYRPSEGLEGAAVFFLGETVPAIRVREQLLGALNDGSPRLLIIELTPEAVHPLPDAKAPMASLLKEFKTGRGRCLVYASN